MGTVDKNRERIEQDFMGALQRLVEGKPTKKILKELLKKGKLKVTTQNVALEAGRARTLIALADSRYPKVREAIKLARGGIKELPSSYTELIRNLRAELAKAKADNKMLQAEIAEHFTARKKAELAAKQDQTIATALRKEMLALSKVTSLHAGKSP